ncbi:MAG: hypothetical protein ACJASX_001987 [Limisphaerales bacterium]|jgi:hypothetical protein
MGFREHLLDRCEHGQGEDEITNRSAPNDQKFSLWFAHGEI